MSRKISTHISAFFRNSRITLRIGFFPFILVFLLSVTHTPAAASTNSQKSAEISRIMKERAEIEQNLRNLKEQLQEYQTKLSVTRRQESHSLKALETIRTRIVVLEKMIGENQKYLVKLDNEIDWLQQEYQGNRAVYGRVSDNFRRTAVSVYKYGGNRDLEHLFASTSFHDALVRAQYMGYFSGAVHRNVDQLQKTAVRLEYSRTALEQTFQEKAATVKEQEKQLKTWSASKKEKEEVLQQLKKNKEEYAAQISAAQKKRRILQSRIESLIMAQQRVIEAEKARRKKMLEAQRLAARKETIRREKFKPHPPEVAEKGTKPSRAPESVTTEKQSVAMAPDKTTMDIEKVSADFDQAVASLPWPVNRGVVTRKFGSSEDKDLAIVTTNNGIDISVPANTEVKAVSGGKVVQIAFLPTFGNIVIIRHPNSYLTVYANLGQLNVVRDELIRSQQLVGFSGKNPEGGSVVHFEIWKGRVKQNPEKWLRR
ncbi:MAG: peptidoglycan DD-metalloendopeptidase family protein [Chlorobiaceae bacterium]|nr:peptidoglycan DD-metalloendopeptidase family protein [Chlorobiaceae bacterium]